MRRLLVVAAVAAAVSFVPAPAQASSCGGHVDTNCTGWVCPTDCWQRQCSVWIDALKNPMTAICIK